MLIADLGGVFRWAWNPLQGFNIHHYGYALDNH